MKYMQEGKKMKANEISVAILSRAFSVKYDFKHTMCYELKESTLQFCHKV